MLFIILLVSMAYIGGAILFCLSHAISSSFYAEDYLYTYSKEIFKKLTSEINYENTKFDTKSDFWVVNEVHVKEKGFALHVCSVYSPYWSSRKYVSAATKYYPISLNIPRMIWYYRIRKWKKKELPRIKAIYLLTKNNRNESES